MSSNLDKVEEIPVPSTTLRSITPPRRFLDSVSAYSGQRRSLQSAATSRAGLPVPVPPVLALASSDSDVSSTSALSLTLPPELELNSSREVQGSSELLISWTPKVVLTPVDSEQYQGANVKELELGEKEKRRPNPSISPDIVSCRARDSSCPLVFTSSHSRGIVRMPIATRKDKRSATVKESTTGNGNNTAAAYSGRGPPRKRLRTSERISESSTTSTTVTTSPPVAAPTTPRKIIQEIFGPDKSKKPKGKGRKRKRGSSPKKKGQSETEIENQNKNEDEHDNAEEQAHDGAADEENGELKEELETERDDKAEVDDPSLGENDEAVHSEVIKKNDEDGVEVEEAKVTGQSERCEDEEEDQEKDDEIRETEADNDNPEEEDDDDDEDAQSTISITRQRSGRKAKQIANEKLKRLSLQTDEKEASSEAKSKEPLGKQEPAGIRSRRSTAEGSSKSGSSTTQEDSESSVGGSRTYINRHLLSVDRQTANPTPLSLISEDGDQDYDKRVGTDALSIMDVQEHRDSDVDSTYSWKPVRAAAAAALEQVTKKQGSVTGSIGVEADAEAKAVAAAERRARKIMRYKGRNRRTLMFKSSSSKKIIAARQNRVSAQPTLLPKVLSNGQYFQPGDIVYVYLQDETPLHGQIRGILMDQHGEVSAGIRWMTEKAGLRLRADFHPDDFEIRKDIPEKLIKIEYVNFVMHLSHDFFYGQPSFRRVCKNRIITRVGRPIHTYSNVSDDDDESSTIDRQSSSSQSDTEEKGKKKNKQEDGNSTDSDEDETDCSNEDDIEILDTPNEPEESLTVEVNKEEETETVCGEESKSVSGSENSEGKVISSAEDEAAEKGTSEEMEVETEAVSQVNTPVSEVSENAIDIEEESAQN